MDMTIFILDVCHWIYHFMITIIQTCLESPSILNIQGHNKNLFNFGRDYAFKSKNANAQQWKLVKSFFSTQALCLHTTVRGKIYFCTGMMSMAILCDSNHKYVLCHNLNQKIQVTLRNWKKYKIPTKLQKLELVKNSIFRWHQAATNVNWGWPGIMKNSRFLSSSFVEEFEGMQPSHLSLMTAVTLATSQQKSHRKLPVRPGVNMQVYWVLVIFCGSRLQWAGRLLGKAWQIILPILNTINKSC